MTTIHDALGAERALTSHLRSVLGCCARCALRFAAIRDPEAYALPEDVLDEATGAVASPSEPAAVCPCCLGCLQHCVRPASVAHMAEAVRALDYEMRSVSLSVSLPVQLLVRERSAWLHLQRLEALQVQPRRALAHEQLHGQRDGEADGAHLVVERAHGLGHVRDARRTNAVLKAAEAARADGGRLRGRRHGAGGLVEDVLGQRVGLWVADGREAQRAARAAAEHRAQVRRQRALGAERVVDRRHRGPARDFALTTCAQWNMTRSANMNGSWLPMTGLSATGTSTGQLNQLEAVPEILI